MYAHSPKHPGHYWLNYGDVFVVVRVFRSNEIDSRYRNNSLHYRSPNGMLASIRHTPGFIWGGPALPCLVHCVAVKLIGEKCADIDQNVQDTTG